MLSAGKLLARRSAGSYAALLRSCRRSSRQRSPARTRRSRDRRSASPATPCHRLRKRARPLPIPRHHGRAAATWWHHNGACARAGRLSRLPAWRSSSLAPPKTGQSPPGCSTAPSDHERARTTARKSPARTLLRAEQAERRRPRSVLSSDEHAHCATMTCPQRKSAAGVDSVRPPVRKADPAHSSPAPGSPPVGRPLRRDESVRQIPSRTCVS